MAGGAPEDTRVVGQLPGLEIEVRHRREAGAELLAVSLRGVPDLERATAWLNPRRVLEAGAAMNPWLSLWRAWGWPVLPWPVPVGRDGEAP